jgi:hypothetical protein
MMIGFVTLAVVTGCGGVEMTQQIETDQSVEALSFQVCPLGQHPGGEITRAWGFTCTSGWADENPPLKISGGFCDPNHINLDDQRIPATVSGRGLKIDVVTDGESGWVPRDLAVNFSGCADSACSSTLEYSATVIVPTGTIYLPSDWGAIWYPSWEVSAAGLLSSSQHTSVRAYQRGCRYDP